MLVGCHSILDALSLGSELGYSLQPRSHQGICGGRERKWAKVSVSLTLGVFIKQGFKNTLYKKHFIHLM